MIKQGIKNYFKNLKYFFTPLGVIALGLVFGLSVLITGTISSISTLVEEVKVIFSETEIDLSALKDSLTSAVQSLDWSDPLTAASSMISNDWLMHTLTDCLNTLVDGAEIYTSQLSTSVNSFSRDMVGYIGAFISFLVVGVICGYLLTKWLVRRNTVKRTIGKYILAAVFEGVVTVLLISLSVWITALWKPGIIVSIIISLTLFCVLTLCEAYLLHGRNVVEMKEVVNIRNILKLLLTDFIILIISAVIILVVILITNLLVGLFVGVALVEIAFIVIGMNAEAYVNSIAGPLEASAAAE